MTFSKDHELPLDVLSVQEMESSPSGRYRLTEAQYEAVRMDCEQGYYKVPQETDLHDLADALGVSHQALSERLRRGINALVTNALLFDQLAHTATGSPVMNDAADEQAPREQVISETP